ncbi:MAG: 1-acyl-sn-glycerol-3-phosphate acyltransferase [Actinomycetales bacterium]|nr:1-acyl-sn-glycerol-3-phosphate acyltransferase [Actinomycetales bacterium]
MISAGAILGKLVRSLCRVSVYGRANLTALEQPGPALIVVNHTTVVDVIVVLGTLHNMGYTVDLPCEGECTHRRHIRPIGTSDLWEYPVTKQACTNSGIIPVDQHDGRAAYRAALSALRNGECVLIYPEGDVKVNDDGSPREWQPGAAGLARSTSVTVVPIAHHDSRTLGSGSVAKSILWSFTGALRVPIIRMRVGKPISSFELAQKSSAEVTEMMVAALNQAWQEASSGVVFD